MGLTMETAGWKLWRPQGERLLMVTLAGLLILCGCQSASGTAKLNRMAAGQAAQIREQIASLGQPRGVPVAGAIAGAGTETDIRALAAELQEISHNARGQEPDGRPPVSPAGSSPAPLSLPPPPATLGKPTTDSPKPAGGESSGVAKLKAP